MWLAARCSLLLCFVSCFGWQAVSLVHPILENGGGLFPALDSGSCFPSPAVGGGASFRASKPWTVGARLQGLQTERQKEMVDLAFLITMASKRPQAEVSQRDVIKGLYIDVSQAISRRPWGRL